MNQKTLNELKARIQESRETIERHNLGPDGFESMKLKIDLKDLASLTEGRMPLYSDHGEGLPDSEISEYVDSIGPWPLSTSYNKD